LLLAACDTLCAVSSTSLLFANNAVMQLYECSWLSH